MRCVLCFPVPTERHIAWALRLTPPCSAPPCPAPPADKLEAASNGKQTMDKYQAELERITKTSGLASRIKFMIQDVIDLRRRK